MTHADLRRRIFNIVVGLEIAKHSPTAYPEAEKRKWEAELADLRREAQAQSERKIWY